MPLVRPGRHPEAEGRRLEVGRHTATTASGNFKTYIPPSNGKFRAKVNQLTLANGVVCGGDTSNVVHS